MSPQFTCIIYFVGEYSVMLDERHWGTEKCHRMNCSQWMQGIQLVLNLTNILWSSLGCFMVIWVKLVNEEHIKRGTRTGTQDKALRKPTLKAASHTGSAVMFSIVTWNTSWCAFPCANLFLLTSLLSARQQKEVTVVSLVSTRACRMEQFPTSFDII